MADDWTRLTGEFRPLMLPSEQIEDSLRRVAAPTSAMELGVPVPFWQDAIRYARFTRDRFSVLDIADDAGVLAAFVLGCRCGRASSSLAPASWARRSPCRRWTTGIRSPWSEARSMTPSSKR
jgi:hypothetical protein